MESPQSSCQSPEPKRKAGSGRQQPLYIRLYFRPHLTELARLLGYGDIPLESIEPQIATLVEQYGQETIDAAREEIMDVVEVRQTFARLKQGVRQIARQLLGPPPNPRGQPVPDVSQATPPLPVPPPPIANDEPEHPRSSQSENAPPDGPPTPVEEEQYLAAYEAHEGQLYCCDQPKLKWFGEIDDLSVACESCGYVLFARDELMPDGEPPGIIIDAESRMAGT